MQNNQPYVITHSQSRTFVQVPISVDPNLLNNALAALLSDKGYSQTVYKESGVQEVVWKKGTGMASAMKYIKLMYQPNMLIISGWLCPGMFSLTICEIPLKGGYAFIPKKSCMKIVEKLAQTALTINAQSQQNYAPQPQQNYAPQPQQNYAPQPQQDSAPQPQQNDTSDSRQ